MRGEFKAPKSREGHAAFRWPCAGGRRSTSCVSVAFTDDDDLVFAQPDDRRAAGSQEGPQALQEACRRAGVRVVRFHDLRHTFGTRIATSGDVSLRTLQEWMGHRDAKTTLIYADYLPASRGGDRQPGVRMTPRRQH